MFAKSVITENKLTQRRPYGGCEMLICKSSFTILFISICMPCAIHNNTDEFNYMQSVIQGLEAKYNPMYDISICKSELER